MGNPIAGAIQILIAIITLDVILSIAMAVGVGISSRNPLVKTLRSITEPLYAPVRRLLPSPRSMGGLDFAPLVVVLLLQILLSVLR